MADRFCDPTLAQAAYADYSPTPVAAGTVPTKPEDGNGKATGPATMATRVITFTGLPTASQTITVAGVTFTAVASGATGNQFNIGADASATATNLRTAINASTTAVVNPTMTVSCPLRNAVNATNSAGVITLYTRIAGSEWNAISETSTLSNVTNNQWSGGADGAWGYFFNPAAVAWPTSVSAGAYGAFPGTYLGSLAAGDVIHIRTKRSGSDVILDWPTSTLTVTARAVGTLVAPLTFLTDNGVKWSGDTGVFRMRADGTNTANRNLIMPNTAGVKQVWSGVKLTGNSRNWRHEIINALPTGNYFYQVGAGGTAANVLELRDMECTGANGAALNNADNNFRHFQWVPPSNAALPRDIPSLVCDGLYYRSQGRVSPFSGPTGASAGAYVRATNCVNDHTGLTLASSDAIIATNGLVATSGPGRFEFSGCRFLGFPAAANLSGFQNFSSRLFAAVLRDCEFTNIKAFGGAANGGFVGTAEDTSSPSADILRSIRIVSRVGNRPSIMETARWAFGWFDSAAPKVSSSTLPDGTTPFSIRCAVTTEAGNVGVGNPVRFPPLGKINSLADGTRTATLRLLVDNNLRTLLGSRNPNSAEMYVEVTYVGTDNAVKTVTSKVAVGGTAANIANGTSGDWSATSYDVNGVSHTYTACQITVSCPDMKAGCEASLVFYQGCQSSSVDDLTFLDPEWTLA